MLFCLRVMWIQQEWKEGILKAAFWGLNFGLFAMVVGSLLPVGLSGDGFLVCPER